VPEFYTTCLSLDGKGILRLQRQVPSRNAHPTPPFPPTLPPCHFYLTASCSNSSTAFSHYTVVAPGTVRFLHGSKVKRGKLWCWPPRKGQSAQHVCSFPVLNCHPKSLITLDVQIVNVDHTFSNLSCHPEELISCWDESSLQIIPI
jgi:hypothetical protein